MRISDWSSDVCSSDLQAPVALDDRDARNGLDCIEHRLLALLDRAEYPVHLGDARFRIFLDKGDDDVVLVIEQSIDLADADRRLGGELGCRRRVKSLRIEQFACRLDDPLSWSVLSFLMVHTPTLAGLRLVLKPALMH